MIKNYDLVTKNLLDKETNLSYVGCSSKEAIRLYKEKEDFRPAYSHDVDRIIHSTSFTRYSNKTQVFSFYGNDNIQMRLVHVTLVSKIARTIGRSLGLNEDLIEAISLGHDIGHTPIGHVGEKILNEISVRELGEEFHHNIQSVRNYMYLENNGKGLNLSIQTLDGIMCHNGERLERVLKCNFDKSKEAFLDEYSKSYKGFKDFNQMTLEGCVVRISDIISYVGRDIEDAIKLNLIDRDDIPKEIEEVLGNDNREIVNNLIVDIINNSLGKDYIELSEDTYDALNKLIKFNYENIYDKANNRESVNTYRKIFNTLYEVYLVDLEENNNKSRVVKYKNTMSEDYRKNIDNKRIVIDFIAGMTDEYLIESFEEMKKTIED